MANDRINTSGNRLGQVRKLPERAPGWRAGEPVSARKLNTMSGMLNRTNYGPNPPAQQTTTGDGGGTGTAVDATIRGQIRFFSE